MQSLALDLVSTGHKIDQLYRRRRTATAQALSTTADRVEQHLQKRRTARVEAIRWTADQIQQHLDEWGRQLHQQLQEQLKPWNLVGVPPSFLRVAGQSHLEKPLNRLLAWWANPDAEHGAGTEFLKRLARLVELQDMVDDLEHGDRPVIRAEQSLDDDNSGKEPDLAIRTKNAALLIENKLWAPESGDQYGPYLTIFLDWAKAAKNTRAVLCTREERKIPENWYGVIRHANLAKILRELGSSTDSLVPVWGRIAAVMCAIAIEGSDDAQTISQARQLLLETKGAVTPEIISRLRALLPLLKPPTPWEIPNG